MSKKNALLQFIFVMTLGISSIARADQFTRQNPPNPQQAAQIVGQTPFTTCANTVGPPLRQCDSSTCPCCMARTSQFSSLCGDGTIHGVPLPSYHSSNGSVTDNLSFNHFHFAYDYTKSETPSCPTCSAKTQESGEPLFDLAIVRIHRYRDVATDSNFGPGAFSNFDAKIYLNTSDAGETSIDFFDPFAFNNERLIDGPYDHPFQPNDPKDGIYVSFKTNAHKDLRLYDATGNLTTDQSRGATAILQTWGGRRFHFQIVSIDGALVGRLTRIEDRNGYGFRLTYRYQPGDPMGGSDAHLWQIDTVTDAHGKQAHFTYLPEQVSGRWVVSQISLPNSTSSSYSYSDGYLSGAHLPDGTQSTITRSFDAVSQSTVIQYFDAAADGTQRSKKVYVTNNYTLLPFFRDDIFPQSASLVRMVVNGDNEVTYLNIPDSQFTRAYIFEGNGLLKLVTALPMDVQYATDWSMSDDGGSWSFDAVQPSFEATSEHLEFSFDYPYQDWYRQEPTFKLDETGRQRSFTYNVDSQVASVGYPDGTTESWTYNEFGEPLQTSDRLGRVTQYTYDTRGNRLTKKVGLILDDMGNVVETPETATFRWDYFPSGDPHQFLLMTSTDANGNVTNYNYDSNQFLTDITEPPDSTGDPRAHIVYQYDSAGRLELSRDGVGRETHYQYDSRSRVFRVHYADTSIDEYDYGQGTLANLLTQSKDRNGNVTTYDYDNTGRVTRRVTAANAPSIAVARTCTHLSGESLEKVCVYKGNRSTYEYDYRNRVISTTIEPNTTQRLITTSVYANNELFATIDPYGRRTFYRYAQSDPYLLRKITETVPSGVPEGADLDMLERNLSPNASFLIYDMEYDAEGQTRARRDGRNIRQTFDYDSRGRQTEAGEAAGTPDQATTRYEYDAQSNRTRIKHPRTFTEGSNFLTELTYTGRNLLKSVTDAAGAPEAATKRYTYYLDRNTKDTTDGRANVWTKVWDDCCARLETMADPRLDDATRPGTHNEYNYSGDLTHVTRLRNVAPPNNDVINERTTKYDARHRPIAQTDWLDPLPPVDPNDPFIFGDPNSPPGKRGLTTRWVYDDDLTDGVGLDVIYAAYLPDLHLGPGSAGSAVEMTNPVNEKFVTVYDGVERAIKTIDGNGNPTTTAYDLIVSNTPGAPGDVLETQTIDALHHVNKLRSDGANRTLSTVDAESFVTAMAYDADSNRISLRDPNSVGKDCLYDSRNREVQCTDTQGDTTKMAYDASGNVVTTTDAFNRDTICAFDHRNRRINCTDRIGGTSNFTYDANNNLLTMTDADANHSGSGKHMEYRYDPRNLETLEIYQDDTPQNPDRRSFQYDGANRLISRVDQAAAATQYVYDMINRLQFRRYPDSQDDSFVYDGAGRLTSATIARYRNAIARSYDPGGRLTGERLTLDGNDYRVGYGYDAANRQTSVTYPDGKRVSRTFTDRNQRQDVLYDGALVANRHYDPGMRLDRTTYGNDLVETRGYRLDDRVSSISIPNVTAFSYQYDPNKSPLVQDNAVNPTDRQSYGYDSADRLTSFNRASGDNQAWTLSLAGDWDRFTNNGQLETRQHDPVHALLSRHGASYDRQLQYDAKGNLSHDGEGAIFTWDFENRLQTSVTPDHTAQYRYDVFGRRVVKTVGTETTIFVYDGWRAIAEYPAGGDPANPLRDFVFGDVLDEVLLMVGGGHRYFYHHSHLFSVEAITNETGGLVEAYEYDPYGRVLVITGPGHNGWFTDGAPTSNVSAIGNSYMFTGQRADSETGLRYYKNRYYSTGLGRFLTRDPIEPDNALNLYEYVRGFATSAIDPEGLHFAICTCCGLDVSDTLKQSLSDFESEFNQLGYWETRYVCTSAYDKNRGWDIYEFYLAGKQGQPNMFLSATPECTRPAGPGIGGNARAGKCGDGWCAGTVTLSGKCYWAGEVNYMFWGTLNRLCYKRSWFGYGYYMFPNMSLRFHRWWSYSERRTTDAQFVDRRRSELGEAHDLSVQGRVAFTNAGWHASGDDRLETAQEHVDDKFTVSGQTVNNNGQTYTSPKCDKCPAKYNGNLSLVVRDRNQGATVFGTVSNGAGLQSTQKR